MSCGPALATFLYPPEQKRRALAIYTMLFGFGLAAGPVAGGILIEAFGWPAVFWYRTPLVLFAFAFAFVLPRGGAQNPSPAAFDRAGAMLLIISLSSFVASLSLIRHAAAMPFWLLAAIIVCAGSTVLFIRQELRSSDPVVHVAFYRDPVFVGIQFATIAINFFAFGVFLLAPYMFALRHDTPLAVAGLMLALYPCGQIAAGVLGTWMSGAVRSSTLVKLGMILTALGLMATGLASTGSSLLVLGLALALAGFGLGLFQVGNLDLTTSILPVSARGVAGSLVNVARLMGIVIGAALITLLLDGIAGGRAGPDLTVFRLVYIFLGAGMLSIAAMMSVTVFRKVR
ncbi:MAG: MFS transporter [Alphaproteobacteria bacterium]|nr:MFS transporter [Alphaproteobacteria bacterium]